MRSLLASSLAAILRDHLEAAAAEAAPPMDLSDEDNPLP